MSAGRTAALAADLLEQAAASSPDTPALRTPDRSITYRELLAAADRTANDLATAGAATGCAVAVWLPNGVDWLIAYWAAALNRNVVVPLSPRALPTEVATLSEHAGAAAIVTGDGIQPLVRDAAALAAASDRSPEAVHLVQFTSGSTGEPKGALLAHRGLVAAARHHAAAWRLAPGEAVFVPNPFSHILGLMYGVLVPAAARATVLTLSQFDLDAALELLAGGEVVALTGAPTHLQMLAERIEQGGVALPRLRLALTGGAPMAPAWIDRVRTTLGLEALVNGYGMSEVGSIAQTRVDDPPERVATSVGFLAPGLEARIVDPESGSDLPDGEIGELWLRGPSVMKGYLRNERLTREALVEGGWLRTGDLLRRDRTGRLSFAGRRGDMITVGGFNVYPAEVERALASHPAIEQAAVVGVADDRLGSVPVAFVRRREEALDEAAVVEHCRQLLRDYMVPRCVQFVDALPVNRAGKVDKRRLMEISHAG